MNISKKRPPKPGEPAADQSIDKKIRRDLHLIALAGLLVPCGLCWVSMRTESFEIALIPLLHGSLVGLYSAFAFYQRQQGKDQALPLWRVYLVFLAQAATTALALAWLVRSVGWKTVPGLLILGLGAWSLVQAGRRLWKSRSFSRRGVLFEVDSAELDMIRIKGSHPIYAQLVYRYAGDYRGELRTDRIQRRMAEIEAAIEERRFRAIVRYLPDDPQVHRLESWWIEKDQVS